MMFVRKNILLETSLKGLAWFVPIGMACVFGLVLWKPTVRNHYAIKQEILLKQEQVLQKNWLDSMEAVLQSNIVWLGKEEQDAKHRVNQYQEQRVFEEVVQRILVKAGVSIEQIVSTKETKKEKRVENRKGKEYVTFVAQAKGFGSYEQIYEFLGVVKEQHPELYLTQLKFEWKKDKLYYQIKVETYVQSALLENKKVSRGSKESMNHKS